MYATDRASKIKSHPVTDLIVWGVNPHGVTTPSVAIAICINLSDNKRLFIKAVH